MADNSQSVVGRALELLREELGIFVARQVERSVRGARRLVADFVGSNHWLERKFLTLANLTPIAATVRGAARQPPTATAA